MDSETIVNGRKWVMDSELGFRMWTKSKKYVQKQKASPHRHVLKQCFSIFSHSSVISLFVHWSVPYPYPKHGTNSSHDPKSPVAGNCVMREPRRKFKNWRRE